ncbi:MFS transporter [Companilactobacillus mishanensis]|uniref:MFS transporter n=1 Tax=Companilactobacillus mishanensis TaxID=2486008 RepID=UPI0012957F0A|nr:MFS transporter [Companilactobacillus mishanensis]MQS89702.1 MFS transporter [Companilactobacillus mishanensis]
MNNVAFTDNPEIQKNRWWIMASVSIFTFMSTLDASIVNIALPVMSKDMSIPMNQSEWVVSIYLITICALLLLFGKLGDNHGKIKIFKIGSILFTIGSLLCGLNFGLFPLLFARAIQSVGAAMTMSVNNGIITEVFPMRERGRALGTIGSFVALGAIAGPGLGGILLAHLDWTYIFWINVPIGILAIIFGQKVLPKDVTFSKDKIDIPGATTFAITMVALFIGVFIGQEVGFGKPSILGLFAIAAISFIAFIYLELHVDSPILSLKLFKRLGFSINIFCALLIFITSFFLNVVAPFYLQNARHLPANYAGYILMILPVLQGIIAPIIGGLSDKIGRHLLTFTGLCILTLSQLGFMITTLYTPLWLFMVFIGLVGFGYGVFMAPNNTLIMSSVSKADLGVAGSINALARELGMAIGISIATTVLFASMSHTAGYKVSTYIPAHPEYFIYGMHSAFLVSLVICLIATVISGVNFINHRG